MGALLLCESRIRLLALATCHRPTRRVDSSSVVADYRSIQLQRHSLPARYRPQTARVGIRGL